MVTIDKKLFSFGDMVAVFATIEGVTQFLLVPKGDEDALVDEKLAGVSPLGFRIDNEPMMHIALSGDGFARDFTSGTTLHILNAPMNAVAQWYTMDGRLCGSRVLHGEEAEWELPEGIYIVRVVSRAMQSTVRVRSAQ